MNLTDKQELDKCHQEMWKQFQTVASVEDDGEEIEIKILDIPWSLKNQKVSLSLKWDSDGSTVFDGDNYVRECLKLMIVEAPWGQTTDIFLTTIGDNALSAALEKLVPRAFEGKAGTPDIDEVKKEL